MEGKKEPTKWEKYAKGKKPSMKRRCSVNDYCDRGIYMITIAIEGRRPILGKLMGKTPEEANVELSAFGERVKACWTAIPQYYPQIEVVKLCVMPDHIHGILFVHERIERHLGHVINGFKTGCRKAARELGIITATLPQPTEQGEEGNEGTVEYTAALPQSTGRLSMGFEPVLSEAAVGYEGHGEGEGALHLLNDDALYLLLFFWIDGEVQFIMHL